MCKMSFQENLKYYREKAGYKQAKDFAKVLDIPYPTYVGYESQGREPKYNTLCKIADLLNVSTDELLGRENNILGMNEDERLKKVINDLIMPKDFASINLDYITDTDVQFTVETMHPIKTKITASLKKKSLIKDLNILDNAIYKRKQIIFQDYIIHIVDYVASIQNSNKIQQLLIEILLDEKFSEEEKKLFIKYATTLIDLNKKTSKFIPIKDFINSYLGKTYENK